ncbi:hypothetical protein FACS1894106_2650 [Spirochaetia bacterium]|nr:hypothetical protein FACS1894106_2650 [Spirochaetia bacterium]
MTYFQAVGIKQDFVVGMQFADACGKTRKEAYVETAKKYTVEQLADALLVLRKYLEDEIETTNALFMLALKSKPQSEINAAMEAV